ncbi:MAG: hypothetical protein BGO43_04860 [Gammaproteobacteria bacterium 39-13]|nr:MATE family efflux transporter [Gammaproteobacteria bacterium]OJV96183.1 MAG: hypothetical protein BGO43_04860 [Gammaproteobacteria bacterium 39-13]
MLATSKTNKIENTAILNDSKGHIRALWRICFPLMLTALSGTLMAFLDRIILAKYDTQAMIAATIAANVVFIFQFGAMSIAMIAEVFVGQYNGAQQWKEIAKPVWQMIWFGLLCAFIMIPLGLFGETLFIPREFAKEGDPYFSWMMIFGPVFPVAAALSAFFIGRGKIKVVTLSVILGNILNLLLGLLLVWGIPGILAPLGAKGAAIATGIAETCVVLGLLWVFLHPSNQEKYQTHVWHFNKDLFIKCIKIGFPNTVGHMIATAAWAVLMLFLAKRGLEHITVISIGFSIWMLFSFITEGLQKGVTAIAANCIGAKKQKYISDVLMTGLKLQFLLAIILAVPLVIMPNVLVDFFIPLHSEGADISHLRELVEMSCRWLWVAYIFDGMAWVIDGILTAAGDTRFIMFMNSIGTWVFCVAPIYLFVVIQDGAAMLTLQLITIYCLVLFASYYFRYRSNKWQNNLLVEPSV